MRILKKMLEERRSSPERSKVDFFDHVIDQLQKDRTMLTEAIALDLMFVLLFASFETTSLALTMAIKYLTDHPQVLDKLTVYSLSLPALFLLFHTWRWEIGYISELSDVTRRSRRQFWEGRQAQMMESLGRNINQWLSLHRYELCHYHE